jgi:hypothetical protein
MVFAFVLGQRVVVGAADTADRSLDAGLGESFGTGIGNLDPSGG